MNTLKRSFRFLSAVSIFSVSAFMFNCSKEESLNYSDKVSVTSEASTDSYFEDAEDISSTVSFATNAEITGRVAGVTDSRLACAEISLSGDATENGGTITIDFGAGCTVGNVMRKGKIIITYTGPRRTEGSSHTITFENFYVNGVKIEGTRTVSVYEVVAESHIIHEITLENGKITWPDLSFATRTAHHFRKWDFKGTLERTDDEILLLADGTATGSNRMGNEYSIQITEDIVFKAECLAMRKFLPASGEKVLLVGGNNGREITVNYGTGTCDNIILVTINGETREVTVSRG